LSKHALFADSSKLDLTMKISSSAISTITGFFLIFTGLFSTLSAQKTTVDGYVFERYNRGFLNEVKITILESSGVLVAETSSDLEGHFVVDVPTGKTYDIQFEKKVFTTAVQRISTEGKKADEKVFVKQELERQPGYLLEVTLAEKRTSTEIPVDAVHGSRIEVYNITRNRDELVIDSAKSPVFSHTLQQGNHYAILIRKPGFFNKRLDAHVNIDGCYLCMEGFGTVTPGVVSNLTSAEDNKLGTLLSNVELEKIDINKNLVLKNIYYAYNSAELTAEAKKELDNVSTLLKMNPSISIELGSHTDARGSAEINQRLSQARAQAAVDYLYAKGDIDATRLRAQGYGETQITNACREGVVCTEGQHLQNRRTELRIVAIAENDNFANRSLGEIVRQEQISQFVSTGGSSQVYQTKAQQTITVTETDFVEKKRDFEAAELPSPVKENQPKAITSQRKPTPAAPKKPVPSVEKTRETGQMSQAGEVVNTTQTSTSPASEITRADEMPQTEVFSGSEQTAAGSANPTTSGKTNFTVQVNLRAVEKYTGYKLELFSSPELLSAEDPDLKMIASEIMSEINFRRGLDGSMRYFVGNFKTWGEAERFQEKIAAKYPAAKMVEFYNGKRLDGE
jgi:outer membrane protein OmpA-like peptidoglycan-associated protein